MLRHAMCNEAFELASFVEVCRTLRAIGYEGIEIAPFTLGAAPAEISASRRRELRATMAGEGLSFVGLHWLMVSPPGLHVTTSDPSLRARSWRHISQLIDLCADLASGPAVMVFGSPKQRGTLTGTTRDQATRHFVDGLRGVASHAEASGTTILVEPLPANQCDVVNTLAEAAAIVQEIASPAIQTMFDTHNAVDEAEPHAALIERYINIIRHVHVNETDGRYPGTGDYDFASVLRALERLDYRGWVSLEVFDFTPDPATIARESLKHLDTLS